MAAKSESVVLLHGWPGTSADFHLVRKILPVETQVFAPDLMGYGEEFNGLLTPDQATANSHADRVIELIISNDIERPIVGGYDIGSRIAQAIAIKAPELIGGLVITPGYPGIGDRSAAADLQKTFWYQHFHRLEVAGDTLDGNRLALAAYIKHFITTWSCNEDIVVGERFEKLIDYYARPDAFRASIIWYSANIGYSGSGQVEVPTTMLWPEQDTLFPIEWADRLSEFFTDANLELIPNCGHFVPLESPRVFANAIVRQLKR